MDAFGEILRLADKHVSRDEIAAGQGYTHNAISHIIFTIQ